MITINNVSKSVDRQAGIQNVSLEVNERKITVLLGAENSGKSLLCDIICGLDEPDSGEVLINGEKMTTDAITAKRNVAYVSESLMGYSDMTVRALLKFVGQARELNARALTEKVEEVIKKTGLKDAANITIKKLPDSFLPRIYLAQAMIGEAANIVLDQPANTAELRQTLEIREMVRKEFADCAVLYATDNITEALSIGDRICVMDEGRIIGISDAASFAEISLDAAVTELKVMDKVENAAAALKAEGYTIKRSEDNGDGTCTVSVETGLGNAAKVKLFGACAKAGMPVVNMQSAKRSLLELVQKFKQDPAAMKTAEEGAEQK